jgi:N-acetyl-alpha-D-glucosaminyl L-malate synthase BshA
MRIGIVCYPTYGGSGVVATELGKFLADLGHKIHFITYRTPTRLDFINENLNYHEVFIPKYPLFEYPPYELALASKMVNVVKYEKLDLLHVHYAIPHASAAFMAKQILKNENLNIPVITTLHGTDITLVGKDISYAPVVAFSINKSDGVTAVSNYLKKDTYEHFKIEQEIEVIPNFIDLKRFKRQKKDHFRKAIAPNSEKVIVHISNFRKVKRVQDVLKIFSGIREVLPSKLLLIGDGPERVKMENLARELQVADDVRFLGKLDLIEEVLSISDLFLLPSEKESFGLAALEAMACEVPVVSSNAGGITELNIHGVTGFVSEVGNINEMVEYSIKILDNENLPKFRKQALENAKKFDSHVVVPKYVSFYEKISEKVSLNVK